MGQGPLGRSVSLAELVLGVVAPKNLSSLLYVKSIDRIDNEKLDWVPGRSGL